jgi:hypothetical protein
MAAELEQAPARGSQRGGHRVQAAIPHPTATGEGVPLSERFGADRRVNARGFDGFAGRMCCRGNRAGSHRHEVKKGDKQRLLLPRLRSQPKNRCGRSHS